MDKRFLAAAFAASALLLSAGSGTAATVYLDRTVFEAEVGPVVTDRFDNDIPTAPRITFDSGVTATKSTDGLPPTVNQVSFGFYSGFAVRDDIRNIVFSFAKPVFAFGADFDDLQSLIVTGLFDGATETLAINDLIGAAGFFGLSSTTAFTELTFSTNSGVILFPGGAPIGGELFNIDDLSFSAPAQVPLPAGAVLLLSGVIGLSLGRRQTRTA